MKSVTLLSKHSSLIIIFKYQSVTSNMDKQKSRSPQRRQASKSASRQSPYSQAKNSVLRRQQNAHNLAAVKPGAMAALVNPGRKSEVIFKSKKEGNLRDDLMKQVNNPYYDEQN